MPRFGAHLSIAGGLVKAPEAAVAMGMDTFQMFTGSPQMWSVKLASTNAANRWTAKPLAEADVAAFRRAVSAAKLTHVTAHDSYLINLAAPDETLFGKSIAAFVVEVERAEALGLENLVTHPGAHTGTGDEAGLARAAAGLDEVAARTAGCRVRILLETTAGQGTALGHRFEHLGELLAQVRTPERYGVCFDTCHAFAAGYALDTPDGYAATFDEFEHVVGLRHLVLFHVNDSLKPRGSRVDRHAGLGLGEIGDGCFRRLAKDARFANTPMILETPKEDADGNPMDPVNLAKLRAFAGRRRA